MSSYSYHHGHYDPWEREFRGFGRVERLDTEGFEQYNTQDQLDIPFETTDVALHAVPIYTKTWYHTGVFLNEQSVSSQYKQEYYQGDALAHDFPDSQFENPIDQRDLHSHPQAYRSLKGQVMREEVYGLDEDKNPHLVEHPFLVRENNVRIRLLQAQASEPFAVYEVLQSETLTYHYERDPEDPRILHDFSLEYDAYGHLLKSCQLAYPRRHNPGREIHPEQLVVACTTRTHSLINETGRFYVLGLEAETKEFEIGGLRPDDGYFGLEELNQKLFIAFQSEIPFSEEIRSNTPQARLLSWERLFYWNDAQTLPLSLGKTSPQALLHHVETAEYPQTALIELFRDSLSEVELLSMMTSKRGAAGGFFLREGYLWNPGDTAFYSDSAKFHLLENLQNPFEAETSISYDSYCLMPVATVDAVGNRLAAELDYRVLQIKGLTDFNDNVSEALFDPLGVVEVLSLYGSDAGRERGDQPLASYARQKEPVLDELLAQPHAYLQGATSFFHYDYLAWKDRKQAVYTLELQRETHQSELPSGTRSSLKISLAYSDGFGRMLQEKLRVEGGKAMRLSTAGDCEEVAVEERWLTSGRTVYNNKGKPIKQYEPFYSITPQYVAERTLTDCGVTPVLHYDPLERVFQTDLPKLYLSKVDFSPWNITSFDANDAVLDSAYFQLFDGNLSNDDQDALDKAVVHSQNTPTDQILDVLARPFKNIDFLEPTGNPLITYRKLDIQGNELEQIDPRLFRSGAAKNFINTYSMSAKVLQQIGVDAGTKRTLFNAADNPIFQEDSRGFQTRTIYDAILRPQSISVKGNGLNQPVERLVYGEQATDAKVNNLRGQLIRHFDQAGVLELELYSFKQELLQSRRRLRQEYKAEVDWTTGRNEPLEGESFPIQQRYDALGKTLEKTLSGWQQLSGGISYI